MPSSATVQQIKGVTANSPLPPSVEYAYYQKCIALKRRINEIEDSNDTVRLRKARVSRAILKMRLERALLLEQLQKRMEHNPDDSDRTDSPPPTNGIDGADADESGRRVENGEMNGARGDVEMDDAQSGFGAGFTAVNR
ncbi:hypothetical protein P152DRAFT_462729 [Eremomyces bilateralis CBS 781.70]|uniref:INO80 complex subunit F domain-containing protein n=1 Tax=Eremomyces bilateralis CBS 781.70 TaxID=1392243 RepID=A0A6G1FR37_9PEZI|nr:uncharacterized protein P152DRAFT_462729 [Eremomyces bilateralis CBS 781.70]KAF1808237.1 hypothetical protein P152DRAFT_462729 [Eremomyces bilateralis CBS 781.70]